MALQFKSNFFGQVAAQKVGTRCAGIVITSIRHKERPARIALKYPKRRSPFQLVALEPNEPCTLAWWPGCVVCVLVVLGAWRLALGAPSKMRVLSFPIIQHRHTYTVPASSFSDTAAKSRYVDCVVDRLFSFSHTLFICPFPRRWRRLTDSPVDGNSLAKSSKSLEVAKAKSVTIH